MSTSSTVELACLLPLDRVKASLCSRHIKTDHMIAVKAILDGRPPLMVTLPVVTTNWENRAYSQHIAHTKHESNLSIGSPTFHKALQAQKVCWSGDTSSLHPTAPSFVGHEA